MFALYSQWRIDGIGQLPMADTAMIVDGNVIKVVPTWWPPRTMIAPTSWRGMGSPFMP